VKYASHFTGPPPAPSSSPTRRISEPEGTLPASPTRHSSPVCSTGEELSPLRSGSRHRILHCVQNPGPHGFGRAITLGLDSMTGDAAVIFMGDESDDSRDVVRYWEKLNEGYDCVFGSRFIKGGGTIDYPPIKLFMNRLANSFVRLLFRHGLNDTTNAFKAYRKEVIEGIRPILSPHFNITVELPLKAIVRGYNFTVIPITWRNRRTGVAKLKIKEMGSRYLFIVLYVWLEKYFSQGDYQKSSVSQTK
jgi:dolichol-phosphate mannosyltransferase